MSYLKKLLFFYLRSDLFSFIIKYDVDYFIFIFFTLVIIWHKWMEVFIANETDESVSRNFIESNEPTNDMGVIEEYEGEYSIENEFEPFVG